jgi:hypothetical protein
MIKLKSKPEIPNKNITRVNRYLIKDGDTLEELFSEYPNGYFLSDYNYNGDYDYYIEYPCPETKEEYLSRYNKYLQELEEYNIWYKKNKEEIENRESKKKEQYIKAKKTRVANLQKELARAEVELSKVL